MAAENALLHPEFLHLLQNCGSWTNIRPQNDRIHAGVLNDLQLMAEISVARHKLLLNHNWMPQAAGRVFEFQNSEAAIAVIHPKKRDSLQTEFRVDVARERVALDAVVLNHRVIPGNDCFWNRGIG